VGFADSSKIAKKIIDIFSDNKVTDAEWYHSVPLHVIQTALPVVINVHNFTKGMERNMQIYGVEIPEVKQYPPRELETDRPTLEDWNFYDTRDVANLLDDSNYDTLDVNPVDLG
jgi:hypothetical protein